MGLINPDVYVTNQGIEKAGTYIAFVGTQLSLRKNGTDVSGGVTYSVESIASIFWDKAARDSGKNSIATVFVQTKTLDIAQNLYSVLYEELKKQYPNAVDA
jgi:hypothetical protein